MTSWSIGFNADEVLRRLDPQQVTSRKRVALARAGAYLEGKLRKKLQNNVVTGKTRASVNSVVRGDAVHIGSNMLTLLFLEVGTKPHIIRPKEKKALAWPGAGAKKSAAGLGRGPQGTLKGSTWDDFINAKSVRHPGTKANGYMADTLDENLTTVRNIFRETLASGLP